MSPVSLFRTPHVLLRWSILILSALGLSGLWFYGYFQTSSNPIPWEKDFTGESHASFSLSDVLVLAPEWYPCAMEEGLPDHLLRTRPAAILVDGPSLEQYRDLRDLAGSHDMLLGSASYPFLHNQFADCPSMPGNQSMAAYQGPDKAVLDRMSVDQGRALGLGMRIVPLQDVQVKAWHRTGTLVFGSLPEIVATSVEAWEANLSGALKEKVEAGLSGIYLSGDFLASCPVDMETLGLLLRNELGFRGLLLAEWKPGDDLTAHFRAGVDSWLVDTDVRTWSDAMQQALASGEWAMDKALESAARWRAAKKWQRSLSGHGADPALASMVSLGRKGPVPGIAPGWEAYFQHAAWRARKWSWYAGSLVLASNPRALLPFQDLRLHKYIVHTYGRLPLFDFERAFEKYADAVRNHIPWQRRGIGMRPIASSGADGEVHVVVLDAIRLDPRLHEPFIASVNELAVSGSVVVLNFGDPENLRLFEEQVAIVQIFDRSSETEKLAAQLLFGGMTPRGRMPVAVTHRFPLGHGLSFDKERLQYSPPQAVGIAPEKLVGIDAIALSAIDRRVMPGCQVVVAKSGKIIYSKAFGRHTYEEDAPPVQTTDLYDLASVSKVAATTLMAMSLHEQQRFDLRASLHEYLSLPEESRLKGLNMSDLMSHQSGLQPYLPVLDIMRWRDDHNAECDSFFCKKPLDPYAIRVADSFYFDRRYLDTIRHRLYDLKPAYRWRRRYSDVNFTLLKEVLEGRVDADMDSWMQRRFYLPLGLRNIGYRPYETYPRERLVPTQLDKRWRHQLLQGYVHDEAAALLGGVAGHAGLFANAEDLAVLFQMMLDGGVYGGRAFLQPETVSRFTRKVRGQSRGLGFDKPSNKNESSRAEDMPASAYGHSGFTGTCVWVDPEEELIFIFLSNRIHPNVRNRKLMDEKIRQRIHQVVYDALDTQVPDLPTPFPPAFDGPMWKRGN